MTARPPLTERMKIDALLFGNDVRCMICNHRIFPTDLYDWDHIHALALGGAHYFKNLAPTHRLCHAEKTHGKPATTAGSDIGKIAKTRRIAKGKMAVKKRALGEKHKSKWPKRRMR